MTRVSRSKLNENQLHELTEHFSYLISSLSNSPEIENFLNGFFTNEERIMLTKRLALFMMIKRGYPYQSIQSALRVSYETVRTYTQQITYKNELFQKTLERLIKRKRTKEFFAKIEKLLKPFEYALDAKRSMKARAKLLTGNLY